MVVVGPSVLPNASFLTVSKPLVLDVRLILLCRLPANVVLLDSRGLGRCCTVAGGLLLLSSPVCAVGIGAWVMLVCVDIDGFFIELSLEAKLLCLRASFFTEAVLETPRLTGCLAPLLTDTGEPLLPLVTMDCLLTSGTVVFRETLLEPINLLLVRAVGVESDVLVNVDFANSV